MGGSCAAFVSKMQGFGTSVFVVSLLLKYCFHCCSAQRRKHPEEGLSGRNTAFKYILKIKEPQTTFRSFLTGLSLTKTYVRPS